MKIGIVGAGNIGSALTHLFRAAGHEVTIANSRGPESLAERRRKRVREPLRSKMRCAARRSWS